MKDPSELMKNFSDNDKETWTKPGATKILVLSNSIIPS